MTPIQLLYKSWAQTDLGEIDLSDWVAENAERVESARERACVTNSVIVQKRKQEWDKSAVDRQFEIGDEVLVRKPGMNLKLSESWEGPYAVTKRNSPLSYAINTGDRHIQSVHVQLMKKYHQESDNSRVSRVTSVFEPDTTHDDILTRYSEAEVVEQELLESQKKDIDDLLQLYPDVMTCEPGLTPLTEFSI